MIIPNITWLCLKAWQRNFDVWKKYLFVNLLGDLAQPVLTLLAFGFGLGAFLGSEGSSYMDYIAPGLIISSGMFSATFECTYGSFLRMKFLKTYDALISTPANLDEVIAGDIIWGVTQCLMSGTIMFIASLACGLIHSVWALGVFPILIAVGFLFSSLGMVMTSLAKTFQWFNYYTELYLAPMFLFSGVFFPLDDFPNWVRLMANALPLTHAVHLSRQLIVGKPGLDTLVTLIVLFALSYALFCLSIQCIKKRLVK